MNADGTTQFELFLLLSNIEEKTENYKEKLESRIEEDNQELNI